MIKCRMPFSIPSRVMAWMAAGLAVVAAGNVLAGNEAAAAPSLKPSSPPAPQFARKPNVIIIYTDDQGSMDAHCYGAKDLVTPSIDSLAARGVRFTQFYAPAPVCSPSRAGLLTGRYPVRAGLATNAGSQRGGGGMPAEQVTIAETMKAAGYVTAHIGKWHLGYRLELMPNAQGFDYSFGHMGGCIDNYSHFFYWAGPNIHDLHRNGREVYEPGRFFPDLMFEEASAFLERNKDRPFFIYYAMNNPHYPYQGEPKWIEHYQNLPYPRNLYAAFVSTLDERIGRLVKKVDDLGLRDNNIIIFQSDQGHSMEERAHGGGGSAGPYRGAKFSLFEGGIRVPAIISWPGHLPEGEVRDQMAHGCDWLPTVAELCGVPLLNRDIDGKSIVDLLHSATAPSPHQVLHWQVGPPRHPQWAVREGDWKLIGNVQDPSGGPLSDADKKLFLSNLARDISERTNFAEEYPDVVRGLLRLREAWVADQEASGRK
jgi:arylsulfatase A